MRQVETDVLIIGGGISAAMVAEKLTEQHDVDVLIVEAGEHSAPLAQSVSLQSENPSQSSSVPFAQEDSESGGRPQSISQEHESSAVSQLPSPQNGGGPQSISQLNPLSIPSQVRSPQQEGVAGRSLQIQSPSVEHRESLQGTAPTPPPAPQQ